MSPTAQALTLSSGVQIPWIAWGNGSGDAAKTPLEAGLIAIKSGIRHIDTAQLYRNESATGEVIKQSGIPKQDIFVTSKLGPPIDSKKEVHSINDVRAAVQESIKKLGFIPDLFLIHNPFIVAPEDLKQTWQILEEMKSSGEIKEIGVSNFRPQDLETILDGAKYKPVVNQIEFHPYLLTHLEPVLNIHAKHGIVTESYGPLTPLIRHPTGGPIKPILTRIAKRISGTSRDLSTPIDEAVVLLLWTRAVGVVAVTTSGNEARIKRLAQCFSLPSDLLTEAEVEEITNVGKTVHFRHYREHMETDFPLPNLPDGTT